MNKLIYILIPALVAIAFSSCKKYDQDGQLIQLRTPEKRLSGDWDLSIFDNLNCIDCENQELVSVLYGSNNLQMELKFDKEGSVEINNTTDDIQMDGDWEFNGDKSILTMTFDRYLSPDTSLSNANVVMYWKVLELERDDFQVYQFREYDGEDIHQYAYYLKMEKR